MRCTVLFLISLTINAGNAFVPSLGRPVAGVMTLANTHMDKSYTVGSGMTEHDIPGFIEKLTAENFEETLEMLEPLLTNECVGEICEDYVTQLKEKAASIGKEIPSTYAPTHH